MRPCALCRRSALCPRSALCCVVQFDPELLADQRRRGWGDRQLNSLGIETRPDGSLIVSVAVERVDGKILRSACRCWQPLHAAAAACRSKGRGVAADSQPQPPSSFPAQVGHTHRHACVPCSSNLGSPSCCCGFTCACCRFHIPGMGGREDWGRSEEDLMRARGAVDEVLTSLGLAPAHFDENLRARVGVPSCLWLRSKAWRVGGGVAGRGALRTEPHCSCAARGCLWPCCQHPVCLDSRLQLTGAPACSCPVLQLFNGLPGLLAVRNYIKGQILAQCQNNIPRLKPDLPPQVHNQLLQQQQQHHPQLTCHSCFLHPACHKAPAMWACRA